MAGHSKWSQIKRKKAVNDRKRGQAFTKLIRELTVAAREGGGDPDFNPRLRLGVEAAKAANMPQENIDRAVKRGTGELEGVAYEEIVYEGYGPGGAALYIEAVTDNQKRTVAELRHILDKNGGNLGAVGSVAWQFDRKGTVRVAGDADEDAVFEAALDAGAEDALRVEGEFAVVSSASAMHDVRAGLERAGLGVVSCELSMVARNEVRVAGGAASRLLRLLDALDDHDDVQRVHSNADVDESVPAGAS